MAIVLKNKNFAKSTLASGITSGATSLTVATGDGTKFPSTGSFRAVIWGAAYSSPTNDSTREIVTVTAVAGDVLTITRAAESTIAKAWLAADHIAHVITAGKVNELEAELVAGWAIRDISRGLIVKNNVTNPDYQVDIDADEIILQDSSGASYRATAVNLTADITVNGVNGCPRVVRTGTATCSGTAVTGTGTLFNTEFSVGDVIRFNTTGVGRRITAIASDISLTVESSLTISSGEAISNGGEAPNTIYYSFVIFDGTTISGLLSTSLLPPVLPSGYTYKSIVGTIYNKTDSNFVTTYRQNGITVVSISSNYLTSIYDDVILCNTTSSLTITLFSITNNLGKFIQFKKTSSDSNTVTIDPNGSETIDGNATVVLSLPNESYVILSCSDTWKAIWPLTDNSITPEEIVEQVGSVLLAASDGEVYQNQTSWTKRKAIQVHHGGAYRISLTLRAETSSSSADGRIYRNGVAVGVERNTTSASPVTWTEDISGWVLGDEIQLYTKNSGAGGTEGHWYSNFRVYYFGTMVVYES